MQNGDVKIRAKYQPMRLFSFFLFRPFFSDCRPFFGICQFALSIFGCNLQSKERFGFLLLLDWFNAVFEMFTLELGIVIGAESRIKKWRCFWSFQSLKREDEKTKVKLKRPVRIRRRNCNIHHFGAFKVIFVLATVHFCKLNAREKWTSPIPFLHFD